MLKTEGFNDYINNIIMSIDDVNGDGKYTVNDFLDMSNSEVLKENGGKKFDIVLMNPPYNNGLHVKFLDKILNITNNVVSVQPLNWLLGKKQNKKITDKLDEYTANIEQIDANIFDAAIGGIIGIIQVNLNKKEYDNNNHIIYNGKQYNKCENIKLYSNDNLLTEYEQIINKLYSNDNLWNHLKNIPKAKHFNGKTEYNPNNNWYVIRIQGMRGHKGTSDFYTLISNNNKELEKLQGTYLQLSQKTILQTNKGTGAIEKPYMEFYFAFNTKKELKNFINYIQTDFVRTILFLHKNTMDLMRGELAYIPWFDFSDEHFSKSPREIDNWLFKKYNISDEIRKHIEEILPDYYGIRK